MDGPTDHPQSKPTQPPRAGQPPRARVILYRARGTEVPGELLEALSRNHAEPIEVDHALGAIAQLCITRPAVLLLCEPDRLEAVPELLAAVERFVPRATHWQYTPGKSPPLGPITDSRVAHRLDQSTEANGTHNVEHPSSKPTDSFALRISTDPLSGPGTGSGTSSGIGAALPGEILTRDEMEALFAEEPR